MYVSEKINEFQITEMTKLALSHDTANVQSRVFKIPVCYANEYALDKTEFASETKLCWDEVIKLHTQPQYLVYMLGFVPGFMYLGGLNKKLTVGRKEVPRLKVAKGSVGIANNQTGVYPIEIPGGWQIIGRTPIDLMPQLNGINIEMGDLIEFFPITEKQFKLPNQTIKVVAK